MYYVLLYMYNIYKKLLKTLNKKRSFKRKKSDTINST